MAEPSLPRRGLGRGLSALLGEVDPAQGPAQALTAGQAQREIPIELLRRNPDQPRRSFGDAELDELAASLKEKGVLQPILVRPVAGAEGEFQIVAGERRWRAAQRAGLRALPAVVRELDDLDVLEIGIIENVQRADLNALEEAQGYRSLMERFGRTQEQVGRTVGKSRAHVANALRLLHLPDSVQAHVVAGRMSAGHARAIAAAADPARLADRIVEGGLSVRQAEALARTSADRLPRLETKSAGGRRAKDADTQALEQDLSEVLGLKVTIEDQGGRGELRIAYLTLEQLDEVCRRLSGG